MTRNTKRIALLSFAAALLSVVILSSSLSNLQLRDGMPFPGGGNSMDVSQQVTTLGSGQTFSSTLLKGIVELIFLILILSVPLRLIPLVNMKRLLQALLVIGILLLAASLLSRLSPIQPTRLPAEPSGMPTPSASQNPVSPLGAPPQPLIWLVATGVVLAAGVLVFQILRRWEPPSRIEDQLAQQAKSAIHAIQDGESLRSVIIRCYLQMSQVVRDERKIERSESMTVRDFEDWLNLKGFPRAPVHQLSHLFERVRYSKQEISEEDKTMAIESLNEIVQFCRSQRKAAP